METIIIIGSGCAGLTASIYAARASLNPLVIEGPLPGGQITTTSLVENFPGFPEGVQGFELSEQMRKQALNFGVRFLSEEVKSFQLLDNGIKKLMTSNQEFLTKTIIIATGASPKRLGIPGEQECFGGNGVTTCATCDGPFYRNKIVCVIGGGDSACEEALFLSHLVNKTYLIHRRDKLRASAIMIDKVIKSNKIIPLWNSIPQKILRNEKGKACGLELINTQTQLTQVIDCQGIFLAIGHQPNTSFCQNRIHLDPAGYIQTQNQVYTSMEGVFAAGDCVDSQYRQAITASGMGCQAALSAEKWLSSQKVEAYKIDKSRPM